MKRDKGWRDEFKIRIVWKVFIQFNQSGVLIESKINPIFYFYSKYEYQKAKPNKPASCSLSEKVWESKTYSKSFGAWAHQDKRETNNFCKCKLF